MKNEGKRLNSVSLYLVVFSSFRPTGVLALITSSCGQATSKTAEQTIVGDGYVINTTSYENYYENDTMLVRVEVKKEDMMLNLEQEEWIFTYDEDKKILSQYRIKYDNSKELFYRETFVDNEGRSYYFDGQDTTNLEYRLYDKNNNLIEKLSKKPLFNEYTKTFFIYDENNRILSRIIEDYSNKKTTTSTFSYETRQDTLIQRVYTNGELNASYYTVQLNDNRKIAFYYNADNFLAHKEETITTDDETETYIVTVYDEEVGLPDVVGLVMTTIFRNGKKVECTQELGSGEKNTTLTEYDHRGNIKKETKYERF